MGKAGIKKRKRTSTPMSPRSTVARFIKKNFSWVSYGISMFIFLAYTLILCCVLTGCGHTITHTDRGTGIIARIPLPDGSSLIDVKIGKIDSTTTVLRGNSTYDSSASTGGTLLGSASTSDRTFVATGIQLNEGYLKEVLTSPSVDPTTKIALTHAIMQVKAAQAKPTVTKSVGAATSSGDNPKSAVEPVAVGLDNIVNRAAEVAPKVVVPVTTAAKSVVKNVSTTVDDVSKDWKLVWIIGCGVVGLLAILGWFIIIKFFK